MRKKSNISSGTKCNRLTALYEIFDCAGNSIRTRKLKCQCDCGKICIVPFYRFLNRYIKSCGCYREEKKLSNGEAAFRKLYYAYKYSAKSRCYNFNITHEQARTLFLDKCFYCGIEPTAIMKTNCNTGIFIYNGIDRIDNSKNYSEENVVSCCYTCNVGKLNSSKEEFFNWVSRVVHNLKGFDK